MSNAPDEVREVASAVVRTDLAQVRFRDYLQRRARWAGRLRALLAEEEALRALERSLVEELMHGAAARPGGDGSDGAKAPSGPFGEVLEAYERRLIQQALQACGGVQRDAAGLLGLAPTTLNEKLKRLGLRKGTSGRPTPAPRPARSHSLAAVSVEDSTE